MKIKKPKIFQIKKSDGTSFLTAHIVDTAKGDDVVIINETHQSNDTVLFPQEVKDLHEWLGGYLNWKKNNSDDGNGGVQG